MMMTMMMTMMMIMVTTTTIMMTMIMVMMMIMTMITIENKITETKFNGTSFCEMILNSFFSKSLHLSSVKIWKYFVSGRLTISTCMPENFDSMLIFTQVTFDKYMHFFYAQLLLPLEALGNCIWLI